MLPKIEKKLNFLKKLKKRKKHAKIKEKKTI